MMKDYAGITRAKTAYTVDLIGPGRDVSGPHRFIGGEKLRYPGSRPSKSSGRTGLFPVRGEPVEL